MMNNSALLLPVSRLNFAKEFPASSLIPLNDAIPVKLDEFMQAIIPYYYQKNVAIGADGDFITAPEISQMFGEIIGIWCAQKFLEAGSPQFQIIELGAGRGTMMSDLLRGTKHVKGFRKQLKNVILVENSDSLRDIQQKTLKHYPKCIWRNGLNDIENIFTIIIANEFFDALPMKQFQACNNKLHEVGIITNNGKLEFAISKIGTTLETELPNGAIIESSQASLDYAAEIRSVLQKNNGAALIIDYGYTEPTYKSTLQALYRHQHVSPLKKVGCADITYHVNFKALQNFFADYGISANVKHQGEFLLANGIAERAQQLKLSVPTKENAEEIQSQLERLVSPKQMGELFKVLEIKI